ncbi:MAG: DUF2752 domain-containing protein [bacterium]
MRQERRERRERGFALFWGASAIATLALAPFGSRLAEAALACPFKVVAHAPCPTCGTLRAAVALARLDPVAAIRVSPLAAIAWIVFIAGGLAAGALAVAGRGLPEPPSRLPLAARAVIVAAILANWAFLIATGA